MWWSRILVWCIHTNGWSKTVAQYSREEPIRKSNNINGTLGDKAEAHKNIPFNFKLEQQNQSTFFFLMVSGIALLSWEVYEMPSLIHGVLAVDNTLNYSWYWSLLIWRECLCGWATVFILRIDDPASDYVINLLKAWSCVF